MNGPIAAVVIFFLLMCVKRLLLSLTPLLRYDTHTNTHTHTHKHTHTHNVVPVLRMGCPTFRIHFQPAFLKPLFSPVVPAMVPLCKCATHSLPFQWLRSLLLLDFIFPTPCKSGTCTISLRRVLLSLIFEYHIRPYSSPR